jgi:hypothetical protein
MIRNAVLSLLLLLPCGTSWMPVQNSHLLILCLLMWMYLRLVLSQLGWKLRPVALEHSRQDNIIEPK